MKTSEYKSYDDLPLFLNAEMVSAVLSVTHPSARQAVAACSCHDSVGLQ